MEFAVLGSLRVRCGETEVAVTRPKSRALLGLLLARANTGISVGQLSEELWLGQPPKSYAVAIRVHVTNLRQCLQAGDGSDGRIQQSAGSYRIAVDPGEVDAQVFEQELDAGRRALESGTPRAAAEILETALGRWRGSAYADLRDFAPLQLKGDRLDRQRRTAVVALADAQLALGNAESVAALVEPWALDDLTHEGLAARLMLALHRCGRSGEALRVYSRLREALDDELGVPPSPDVRALEEGIVLERADLELAGLPAAATASSTSVEPPPFVGHHDETSALEAGWERARAGQPQLVLITGPTGIGKTALTDRFAQSVRARGATVLVGRSEPDPASDYEPFPQLVRQAFDLVTADPARAALAPELAYLVPELADQLAPPPEAADASAGRHRLFLAVSSLLQRLVDQPTLFVLDDLHWAGRDALALLRHVFRDMTGPVMVVGAFRDDEAEPGTPLGDALEHGRLAHPDATIRLHGLDPAELQVFVQAAAPRDLSGRLLADLPALHELTAGNPLYVREVVKELADDPGITELTELAPGGVAEIVERRLSRIPAPTRDLLSVAAVLGREFSVRLLATTAKLDEDTVLDRIDDARRRRFVTESDTHDTFTFAHPLIRNAIYVSMTTSRRTRLHLRAGESLLAEAEEAGAGLWAEPARHLLSALPLGSPARAARCAQLAGDDAAARFAHTDAAAWYRSALRLASDADWSARDEAATLLSLGVVLERSGQRDQARPVYVQAAARARAAGDVDLFADIAIAATPRYVTLDEFQPTQVELVEEALRSDIQDPKRRVWLLSCAGSARYYSDGGSDQPPAREALDLGRAADDPEVLVAGLLTYHRWLTHDAAAAEERLSLSREMCTVCEQQGLHHLVGRAYRTLLVDLLGVGALQEFGTAHERFTRLASRHGVPSDLYWVAAMRATRALARDPGGDTEELIDAAELLGRRLEQGDAKGVHILQLFALRYQQGRSREVTGPLEDPGPQHPRVLAGLAILAAALVAADRHDNARAILDRVVRDGVITLPRDNLWHAATALFGGVAAAVGTPRQRAALTAALTPLADLWCVFGAGGALFGTTHHWLARLALAEGDRAGATAHLHAGAAACETAGADYWAGVAQQELQALV